MLVLSGRDVEAVLTPEVCIEAMASALADFARKTMQQPVRSVVRYDGMGAMMGLMPAARSGANPALALKDVVVVLDNPTRGLDPHQGAVLLHDGTTGQLVAVIDATALTAVRTAAVSAAATRALARPESKRIAIVGTGFQAHAHATALRALIPDASIAVWGRTPAHAAALAERLDAGRANGIGDATRDADIICVCTTSTTPVLDAADVADGAHINAIGAFLPTARELSSSLIARAEVFVDSRAQARVEAGDLLIPEREGAIGADHVRAELGEVLAGLHPGRSHPKAVTVFKSLGLAIEDLVAAELAVSAARKRGLGVDVPF